MIDWQVISAIWAAYGVNIIVLVILLIVVWILGLVVQKLLMKNKTDSKEG